jgi:hypothetical protein
MTATDLMDRSSAGILISLHWVNGKVVISVSEPGEEVKQAEVPAEHALDAFAHPYPYLRLPAVKPKAEIKPDSRHYDKYMKGMTQT